MSTDLATRNGPARELVSVEPSPIDNLELLDVYAGGVSQEAPRPEWLATISAGELVTKDNKTYPRASRDGTIFLHDPEGRAPGLKARLAETGNKRLTIAFPWDSPAAFIQQRFERRSATKLEAYGDQHQIRVLSDRGQQTYDAGTEGYAAQVATCKVVVSVLFTTAVWGPDGPEVEFPDGLGSFYRLRFTSRNSLRSIVNTLRQVGRFTSGRLAGIPFDLSIDYRDVADGTGTKRHVAVWVINMRPPGELRLTSRNFSEVMTGALDQGSALMLPAPSPETLEMAALDAPAVDLDDLSDDDAELLARGGSCDATFYEKAWFAIVDGTDLDSAEARAKFLWHVTGERFSSLSGFLAQATEAEAQGLINEVSEYVLDRSKAKRLGVELPSAVSTGRLERNAFIELAMDRFGYPDRLAIARALGQTTLNGYVFDGTHTWNDALAELERIESEKETLRNAADRAHEAGVRSDGDLADAQLPAHDDDWANVEEQDEPEEDDRPTSMTDEDFEREPDQDDPGFLLALWTEYGAQRAQAAAVGIKKLPEQPSGQVTGEDLRAATAELGRLIAQAQRQGQLV